MQVKGVDHNLYSLNLIVNRTGSGYITTNPPATVMSSLDPRMNSMSMNLVS